MKRMTGCEMKKVSAKDWKEAFESKSDIPVIENTDPDTVVLPFIPNVNAYDAFANRKEIKDFGECEYLRDAGEEELLLLADRMMQKIQELHEKGIAWGEVILPNFIIDKEKQAYICDPEVRYSDRIALAEQKARDLLDFLHSLSAAMNQTEGTDYQVTVQRMLDQYEDDEVLGELKRLAEKKPKLRERIFFGYTQVRLGQKKRKNFKIFAQRLQTFLKPTFLNKPLSTYFSINLRTSTFCARFARTKVLFSSPVFSCSVQRCRRMFSLGLIISMIPWRTPCRYGPSVSHCSECV
jgi:tRNA A-37 threonylcarbamoyl transferase component Bud32